MKFQSPHFTSVIFHVTRQGDCTVKRVCISSFIHDKSFTSGLLPYIADISSLPSQKELHEWKIFKIIKTMGIQGNMYIFYITGWTRSYWSHGIVGLPPLHHFFSVKSDTKGSTIFCMKNDSGKHEFVSCTWKRAEDSYSLTLGHSKTNLPC